MLIFLQFSLILIAGVYEYARSWLPGDASHVFHTICRCMSATRWFYGYVLQQNFKLRLISPLHICISDRSHPPLPLHHPTYCTYLQLPTLMVYQRVFVATVHYIWWERTPPIQSYHCCLSTVNDISQMYFHCPLTCSTHHRHAPFLMASFQLICVITSCQQQVLSKGHVPLNFPFQMFIV